MTVLHGHSVDRSKSPHFHRALSASLYFVDSHTTLIHTLANALLVRGSLDHHQARGIALEIDHADLLELPPPDLDDFTLQAGDDTIAVCDESAPVLFVPADVLNRESSRRHAIRRDGHRRLLVEYSQAVEQWRHSGGWNFAGTRVPDGDPPARRLRARRRGATSRGMPWSWPAGAVSRRLPAAARLAYRVDGASNPAVSGRRTRKTCGVHRR